MRINPFNGCHFFCILIHQITLEMKERFQPLKSWWLENHANPMNHGSDNFWTSSKSFSKIIHKKIDLNNH
jgi:hypothetical protein